MVEQLMGIPLFALAAVQFVIFLTAALVFIQKRQISFRGTLLFFLMGLSFLPLGYATLLEFFGQAPPFLRELSILQTLVWSAIFTNIISSISGMKKLRPLTFLTLLSTVLIFFFAG